MSKRCPKCNSELPEESSFCLKCFSYIGQPQQELSAETPKSKNENRPSAFRMWIKMHLKF